MTECTLMERRRQITAKICISHGSRWFRCFPVQLMFHSNVSHSEGPLLSIVVSHAFKLARKCCPVRQESLDKPHTYIRRPETKRPEKCIANAGSASFRLHSQTLMMNLIHFIIHSFIHAWTRFHQFYYSCCKWNPDRRSAINGDILTSLHWNRPESGGTFIFEVKEEEDEKKQAKNLHIRLI